MAYQGPDGRWYAGQPGDYPNTHNQNRNISGTGAARPGAAPATPGRDSLLDLVYGTNPQDTAYFNTARGNALRGIAAQYAPQRSYALQALEARGLGRSSEVGRTLGALAGSQGLASQQAIADISGQEFAARQTRVNMYLNYLLQKKLQKSGGSVLDILGDIGQSVGGLLYKEPSDYGVVDTRPYYPGGQSGGGYG